MFQDITTRKNHLRQLLTKKTITPKKISLESAKIKDLFFRSDLYNNCSTIFTYVSTPTEVDTLSIIKQALSDGKVVAIPKFCMENNNMIFYPISDLNHTNVGIFNILQPITKFSQPLSPVKSDICIVPALAYSKDGFRLGHGRGYYDRFLSHFKIISIGLCYIDRLFDTIPHCSYDQKVQYIITANNFFSTSETSHN